MNINEVLYEEKVQYPLSDTRFRSLWGVMAFRIFLLPLFILMVYLLVSLVLEGNYAQPATIVLIAGIILLYATDRYVLLPVYKSGLPIRIYKNGIELPTTKFEQVFSKSGFIPKDEIKLITPKHHNIVVKGKIKYNILNEFIVTRIDGQEFRSYIKNEEEIRKILEILEEMWPDLYSEFGDVQDLSDRDIRALKKYEGKKINTILTIVYFSATLVIAISIGLWFVCMFVEILPIVFAIAFLSLVIAGYFIWRARDSKEKLDRYSEYKHKQREQ